MEPSDIPSQVPPRPSLRSEIAKGWHWVIFVWQMLGRMGGPAGIARSVWLILAKMVRRTLVQWGLIRQ